MIRVTYRLHLIQTFTDKSDRSDCLTFCACCRCDSLLLNQRLCEQNELLPQATTALELLAEAVADVAELDEYLFGWLYFLGKTFD